jgi:hypothetical protein
MALSQDWIRRSAIGLAAAALLGVAWLLSVAGAQAAPAAPLAGTLTVNSIADTNSADSHITLREALFIARGGTGAAGLNRALSDPEKMLLVAGGCAVNSSNRITSGCGAGVTDTIRFSGIGTFGMITLTTELPAVNDTRPTTILGAGAFPTLNANVVHTNYGLQLLSDGNRVQGVGVTGAWRSDFVLAGDHNTLFDVWAWRSNEQGVTISGSYDTVDESRLGVNGALATVCGPLSTNPGNTYNGVYITASARHATVQNSYLGCNAGGVYIVSSVDSTFHTIGPNNWIGVTADGGGSLSNHNSGVSVNAFNNVVMSNTIAFNGDSGVDITGNFNYVGGNTIRNNYGQGIVLRNWASNNTIGQLSFAGPVVGNAISGNWGSGIDMTGTNVSFNVVVGNLVGLRADGVTADGNGGDAVHIYAAHHNFIGGPGVQFNILSGNDHAGVRLLGGAYNNRIAGNRIGSTALGQALPNDEYGVAVLGGAHDNVIGVTGALNVISNNANSGVLLAGGAHDNTVGPGWVGSNGRNGIEMDGPATNGNVISETLIAYNALDGINTRNGATGVWTHMAMAQNGGLPIDTDAPSDAANTPTDYRPFITSILPYAGNQVVSGVGMPSPNMNYKVEVHLVMLSGARIVSYAGTALLNPSGEWGLPFPNPGGDQCYAAFQTYETNGGLTISSELGPTVCRYWANLPVVTR